MLIINISLMQLLLNFWKKIGGNYRFKFCLLFLLALVSSIAEVVSIGLIVPFLGILVSPDDILNNNVIYSLANYFQISKAKDLLTPITLIFIISSALSGMIRVLLVVYQTRLGYSIGGFLSITIFRRTLEQSYQDHVRQNSSEVISGIAQKTDGVVNGIVLPLISILSASVLISSITTLLFYASSYESLMILGVFTILYALIIRSSKKILIKSGEVISKDRIYLIKILQESLGAIRDIIIDNSKEYYCRLYELADIRVRRAQTTITVIASTPRYVIESIATIAIALIAKLLVGDDDKISQQIPYLGVLALSAQRLLPLFQQTYHGWTQIQSNIQSLMDVMSYVNNKTYLSLHSEKKHIVNIGSFEKSIQLEKISFGYDLSKPLVLKNINLEIFKGERLGIIGATGSGKSTLLDIILMLLQTNSGNILVDGIKMDALNARSWQNQIAHVPQTIFLADASIYENIAFGIDIKRIDRDLVHFVSEQAQIASTISNWDNGYETIVGERGVRLSGGQRQRIGIARALYKKSSVIIFDEATSALDENTEAEVMQAIEMLNKNITLVICAHRTTTLKNCTKIVELANGVVNRIGTYEEIIGA
jgi:ATP-binding cassette, subfamily B, bacterial PglK